MLFHRKMKVIQLWNDTRVRLYHPFNCMYKKLNPTIFLNNLCYVGSSKHLWLKAEEHPGQMAYPLHPFFRIAISILKFSKASNTTSPMANIVLV